jgi:hypothetical protein
LLLPLLSIVAFFAFIAPASAQPDQPELVGTHPSSPGVSTTPRVYGWGDEIFTSSLGGSSNPIARAGEEGTITIYATPDCSGLVAATGSPSALQKSGIVVNVAPGLTTAFSATHSDLTGVSSCSNAIEYRQVSDPPDSPTVTAVDPASPADDNLPHVFGGADPGSTVAIYADSACSGSPLGSGSAALFASAGIQASVSDNSTTTFYARASWAELPSACSSTSVTYQEVSGVSPGPGDGDGSGGDAGGGGAGSPAVGGGTSVHTDALAAPKLHTVPGGRSSNPLPLVTGSAAGASRVQIYKNAACTGRPAVVGSPSQLSDGFVIEVAEDATTKFYGEAIDVSGKVSDCSEPVSYFEDSTPPLTRITFGPGVKTRKRVAIFRFADITDDPPGTTFLCKFDRRPWKACQAPLKLPRLRPKAHTLRVKAIDAAGNEEVGGASRRFKVIRRL